MAAAQIHALMRATMFDPIGGDVSDRPFLTDWYLRRNRAVLDGVAAGRLLHFDVRHGWQPLCEFLDAPVPDLPFPRTNSRAQLGRTSRAPGVVSSDPQARERFTRLYIEMMRNQAFAGRD